MSSSPLNTTPFRPVGGTGDPHLIVAEEGLSEAYESPQLKELHDWALKQYEAAKKRSVGVYSGAVGFGFNKELLAKKNVKAPSCWADLVKPEYKGEIQVANPNSSGTAYVIIATLVQLMGEDKAFEFMKAMHQNVNAYARSGTGPIKAVARGETSVSLSFVHDAATEANAGFPVGYATPAREPATRSDPSRSSRVRAIWRTPRNSTIGR
jgi:iron(III) transport system substrate-binding protein